MKEVLVLGAEGCGKTLFISRLKTISQNGSSGSSSGSPTSSESSESTAPTVGVELTSIEWDSCCDAFLVREVGSSLSLRWESFIPECSCLVFLVDCSDFGSFSSSLVLLAEVLSAATLTLCHGSKSVLLAFNKSDLADSSTIAICYNVLDIDGLLSRTDINVTFVTGSSIDCSLCYAALRWMTACVMQP